MIRMKRFRGKVTKPIRPKDSTILPLMMFTTTDGIKYTQELILYTSKAKRDNRQDT